MKISLPTSGHPWLRGDGVFETIRTEGQTIFFLERHLARLRNSAAKLHFEEVNGSDLFDLAEQAVIESDIQGVGRLRITKFSNGENLVTHEAHEPVATAARLVTFPDVRASYDFLNSAKTLSYARSSTALRWANANHGDDAIFINERTEVMESALANLLFEIDGVLITPSLESGGLPGTIRQIILEWFPQVQEGIILQGDLPRATGAALLSSLREVQMVASIDLIPLTQSNELLAIARQLHERARRQPNYC
jgi:branched-subunit amino acid aminotransferase/4-amino-4-deoxychorismate lyase